jgi:hypothetical protein
MGRVIRMSTSSGVTSAACFNAILCRERARRVAPLGYTTPMGEWLTGTHLTESNLVAANAAEILEMDVFHGRRSVHGAARGNGFGDDPTRDRLPDELDVLGRDTVTAPPCCPGAAPSPDSGTQLKIRLLSTSDFHDERKRLVEERGQLFLEAELEKTSIVVSLATNMVTTVDQQREPRPQHS